MSLSCWGFFRCGEWLQPQTVDDIILCDIHCLSDGDISHHTPVLPEQGPRDFTQKQSCDESHDALSMLSYCTTGGVHPR